jgi:hypothetical protein
MRFPECGRCHPAQLMGEGAIYVGFMAATTRLRKRNLDWDVRAGMPPAALAGDLGPDDYTSPATSFSDKRWTTIVCARGTTRWRSTARPELKAKPRSSVQVHAGTCFLPWPTCRPRMPHATRERRGVAMLDRNTVVSRRDRAARPLEVQWLLHTEALSRSTDRTYCWR